jgi:hypothetical protein
MALALFGLPSIADVAAPFKWFSITAGIFGLTSTGLFVARYDLGLGPVG